MGPKLNDQVCYTLYSTSRAITQAYKGLLEPLELTYPQFVVMMALWELNEIKITTISDMTGLTNATLTPLLQRLEAVGYIQKSSIKEDERQKVIKLTSSGKSLASKANVASQKALCDTGLSKSEAASLMSLCSKIKTKLS